MIRYGTRIDSSRREIEDTALDVDDLRAFVVLAQELHFGNASKILGTSQPAVSRRLRSLEAEVGAELLTRTSRRVALTPAGSAFLEDATAIVDRADDARRRAREVAIGRVGHVRVAAVPGAMAGFIPHIVRAHRREHGSISLSLHELLAEAQIERLRQGELDVGFVRGISRVDQDLVVEPLHQELMGVVVPDTHRLASHESTTIAALEGENLILPPRNLSPFTYDRIVASCRACGFEAQIVQEAATASAILGLVSAEVGVAVLAEDFHTLLNQHVRLVPLVDFTIALSMLWRPNPSAAVSTVLQVARDVSSRLPQATPSRRRPRVKNLRKNAH